jgi:ParB-like chromosome segregation protein Spo0J
MHVSNIPIDELKPFVKNPKKHPEKQIKFLQKSFREFGWTNPILVAQDNMIVAGHGRWEAAKQAGFTEVPVIKLDMPYEKAVAYVVADNHLAELAETDTEQLAELLQEISQIEDFDIEAVGYSDEDIEKMLAESDSFQSVVSDDFDDVPSETDIKIGDVIQLGKHRLMCGNSSNPEHVKKLIDSNVIDLLYFDPPYENMDLWKIDIPANKSLVFSDARHIKDAMILANRYEYIYEFVWDTVISWYLENRPICRHRSAFLCQNISDYDSDAMVINDGVERKKTSHINNLGEYNYQPLENGNVRLTTVFPKSKASLPAEHGKPIEWIGPIIAGCHPVNVLDVFAGAGSTLMACEQIGIPSFNMELDPIKCQLIVDRYNNQQV